MRPALLFLFAALLRLGMLIYGRWQDATMVVKYTDIDYVVFTDAARYVHAGLSPYLRSTYRYTPLLAYALTPNVYFPEFGKLLFAASDLVAGYLVIKYLVRTGLTPNKAANYAAFWLLNPIVANVSTRGSAEGLLAALCLAILVARQAERLHLTAFLLALATHMKIYPGLYAFPLWLSYAAWKDRHRLMVSTFLWFAALTGAMYALWGYDFLHETYLYHVTRQDHRHNFSIYFYPLYLGYQALSGQLLSLFALLPQVGLAFSAGWTFQDKKRLPGAFFLQTLFFVAFNKVMTTQYFLWYLAYLPLVLPYWEIDLATGARLICEWWGAQLLWLWNAFYLEHRGQATFSALFFASLMFLGAHVDIGVEFVRGYRLTRKERRMMKTK